MPPRAIVITGPTASGKTDAALALQDLLGGTQRARIISIDSAMVYRGLDIGTAKPGAEVLAAHPHELIDIRDPAETYSAADFVGDADALIEDALRRGQVPLLVGGTMLYLRCLREGIAELPPADPQMRAALAAELERRGADALHAELEAVDAPAAAKIHPHNTQRLLRALEVYRLTATPMSALWRGERSARERLGVELQTFAVGGRERQALHARIERRFDAMLRAGFLDEVRALRARGDLDLSLPAMRAVGYRQAWRHLAGELDFAEFRAQALAATRQLAKRQLTWLRGWHDVTPLPGSAERAAERIAAVTAD